MPLVPYRGRLPRLAAGVWIAPNAYLIGDVQAGEDSNVWFGCVLRGDSDRIVLGRGVNIQDNCTLHADPGQPAILGDYVALGHNAIVHAATVEERCLIGIGAVVLTGAVVGAGSIVGARALVTEGAVIPPRSLVLGVPGRVVRQVTDADYERIVRTADNYLVLSREYREAGI